MTYTKEQFFEALRATTDLFPGEFTGESAAQKLFTMTSELDRCSGLFNLTAITDAEEVMKKHVLDCLFLAAKIKNLRIHSFIDIGSGAGFPALPCAAVLPDVQVCALDSTAKKMDYVRNTATLMGLSGFQAISARAEEAARTDLREAFDCATARAVARLSVLLELCTPFIRVGGFFIAMKGASAKEEAASAANAAHRLGCTLAETVPYSIPGLEDQRFLLIYSKNSATSEAYPRIYSQISKKPL